MARLSAEQIARHAHAAGIVSAEQLANATAIALAESGGQTGALNPGTSSRPETSVGLWQINRQAHPRFDQIDLTDPVENAKAMMSVSNGGTNWGPWSVWWLNADRRIGPGQGKMAGHLSAGNRAARTVLEGNAGGTVPGAQNNGAEWIAASSRNGDLPPEVLAKVGNGQTLWVNAAASFETMRADAKRSGVTLTVGSGYRTRAHQQRLVDRLGVWSQTNQQGAAPAGKSNHGWGAAADVVQSAGAIEWLRDNGSKYGWAGNVPGEPWHWEFTTQKPNTHAPITVGSKGRNIDPLSDGGTALGFFGPLNLGGILPDFIPNPIDLLGDAKDLGGDVIGAPGKIADGFGAIADVVGDTFGGIKTILEKLIDPGFWAVVGIAFLGILLIFGGLWLLFKKELSNIAGPAGVPAGAAA